MGLGKTLQVLTWLARCIEDGRTDDGPSTGRDGPFRPILIVAPLMLVDTETWTREMEKRFRAFGAVFRPWHVLHGRGITEVTALADSRDPLGRARLDASRLMQFRVVITTYETIVNYQHSLAQLLDGKPIWSIVVTDEAQKYKDMQTKVSHAIKALSPPFHVAATGTPVETRLLNLWNIMDAGQPGLLGTAREFSSRFEAPIAADKSSAPKVLGELRERLRFSRPNSFILRRGKEELTDLPPKHQRIIECQMNEVELEHELRLISALKDGAGTHTLQVLQELVARGQHPSFAGGRLPLDNIEALIETSSKLSATMELLHEMKTKREKVLIFARHVAVQQLLSAAVRHRFGIDVAIINGQTGRSQTGSSIGVHRRRLLDRFEASPGFNAIVLSPFVAGVGLTITAANHVIHYGRWWNPAVESQATDRAYRIGQQLPVTVYYPMLKGPKSALPNGSFDEVLHALIERRQALARDFLHPEAGEGELAEVIGLALAGNETADSKTWTLDEKAPEYQATVFRMSGWLPILFSEDGHAGARLVAVRGSEGQVLSTVGVSAADAVRSWSRLVPDVQWTAASPNVRTDVRPGNLLEEKSRQCYDPALAIRLIRSAVSR